MPKASMCCFTPAKVAAREHPDRRLDMVGDAELRDELSALRDPLEYGAVSAFFPRGASSNRCIAMRRSFCLPSRSEGFGLGFIEPMVLGLPGHRKQPRDRVPGCSGMRNALLVPVDDAATQASCISRLPQDANLGKRLAEEGRVTARRFGPKAVRRAWCKPLRYGSVSTAP